jgi:GPH family glycoside/pentoside/hexuronide:cation symporter
LQGTLQAVIAVVGIPLAKYLSLKLGKAPTLALGMGCSLAAYIMTYFMMTPEMPYLSIVPFVMMGPATSMIWIMIPSMTGDVIDYDEWKNGERAEGSYTAVYSWTVKLAQTMGVLSGFLVAWAGYRPEIRDELAQHTDVLNNMRLMLTGIPSTFLFIAMVCLILYPLKAKRVHEIRRDLESRRGTV